MFFPKMPFFVPWIFPDSICRLDSGREEVYLTFDDGPTPGETEFVLDTLAEFDAKAVFFCLGKNAALYPHLIHRILAEGHLIGNHTQTHANAWKVSRKDWLQNVAEGRKVLEEVAGRAIPFFRPPYGKLTIPGYRAVNANAKVVLWDVISGDFSAKLSPEQVLQNATQKVRNGSVIVFHDSVKCAPKMRYALPKALAFYREKGWKMSLIPEN